MKIHTNNPCDPKWAKAKDQLPLEKKTFRPRKRTTVLIKKIVFTQKHSECQQNSRHFFFLLLQSCIQLTKQQLISVEAASETTEDGKNKNKTKLLSPYITNLCCAPTRTCFNFHANLQPPDCTRQGQWLLKIPPGQGQLKTHSVVC